MKGVASNKAAKISNSESRRRQRHGGVTAEKAWRRQWRYQRIVAWRHQAGDAKAEAWRRKRK